MKCTVILNPTQLKKMKWKCEIAIKLRFKKVDGVRFFFIKSSKYNKCDILIVKTLLFD